MPFVEKNLARDASARNELIAMRMLSLPVLVIGETKLSGFNPDQIAAALAQRGTQP